MTCNYNDLIIILSFELEIYACTVVLSLIKYAIFLSDSLINTIFLSKFAINFIPEYNMKPKKEFKIGEKYTIRELQEFAIVEMSKSIPEHEDRTDPRVGAILATVDGVVVETAHRGELRSGDHAEFTVLERKCRNRKVEGYIIFATLEPCAPGARKKPKLSCAERIVNGRIKKVYIGI